MIQLLFILALAFGRPAPGVGVPQAVTPQAVLVAQEKPALSDISTEDVIKALLAAADTLIARRKDYAEKIRQIDDALQHVVPSPTPIPPTPVPPAPVPPTPVPPPTPLSPYGAVVQKMVLDNVTAYPDRPAMARTLGAIYQNTNVNAYPDRDSMVADIGSKVVAALGADLEKWRPFFNALRLDLNAKSAAGVLPDNQSYAPVWKDVAAGLESIQ